MIARLFLALLATASFASAQTSNEPGPPPASSLIRTQAPDFSQWVIEYQYPPKAAKSDDGETNDLQAMAARDPAVATLLRKNPDLVRQAASQRLSVVRVTRTGPVSHEELAYEDGTTEEHGFTGKYRLTRPDRKAKISVVSSARSTGSDFPEFSWITRENFTGGSKSGGRDCITFQMETDPMRIDDPGMYEVLLERQRAKEGGAEGTNTPSGEKTQVFAVIDAETKLPLTLRMGKTSRRYKFFDAPKQSLVLPPEWVRAAEEHDAAHRLLMKPVSRP